MKAFDILKKAINGSIDYDASRKELLLRMGFDSKKEPPMHVSNAMGEFVNPLFMARMVGQFGMPKEMVLDFLGEKGLNNDWSEWCDFWLDTFLKGDHAKIRENFIDIQ